MMKTTPRRPRWPLLALIAALTATTPQLSAQQGVFQGRTSVLAVEVPVQVTHGGEPLRGLTIENFQVLQGKKAQPIIAFEEIDLGGFSGGGFDTPPAAARRHFMFLFDLSFSDAGSLVRARHSALELAEAGLHPTDLVSVATYSDSKGAELVLGFTTDRTQLEVALAGLGLFDPVERIDDPLRLLITDAWEAADGVGRGAEGPGEVLGFRPTAAQFDAFFVNFLRDVESLTSKTTRNARLNQVLAMSSSFDELAGYLQAVDGRKHVVLFSEGFDSSLVLGTEDFDRMDEIAANVERGEYWLVNSDERFGNTSGQRQLSLMLERFRRSDCAIQAVDIGGLRAGGDAQPRPDSEEAMFMLANQTGGEFYRNYNDLSEAMSDLLDRTSVTYILTIQPQAIGPPGEYQPIKVKLKGAPRNARLSHRPGYYYPRPLGMMQPEERRMATASRLLAGEEGGEIFASVLAAPIRTPAGGSSVLTLIEVDGHSLLAGDSGASVPAEIYAYALDSAGGIGDFFSQAIDLDLSKVGAQLRSRGFKLLGDFELAPGEYQIRVLVRNGRTGAAGLRTQVVEVPDFEAGETSLLPPFFVEPEGTWLLGRAERAGGRPDYGLTYGGRAIIPAALPTVYVNQPAPILLVGHGLGDGPLAASGTLTAANGSRAAAQIEVTGRLPEDESGLDRLLATFSTGELRPGSYDLNVTLTPAGGGSPLTSSIPIIAY